MNLFSMLMIKLHKSLIGLLMVLAAVSSHATPGPEDLMATQYVVLAKAALFGQGELRPDQLTRARILLDLAIDLQPNDPDLRLLSAELAEVTGDESRRMEALRRYVQLRPDDDAIQLALIQALIGRQQTLDAQLDAAERILTSGSGKRFSRPLRSRLAIYAASAAWELGDTTRYAQWVQEAVKLDPTNGQAATMLYNYILGRDAEPRLLGAAAVALVRAKPFDADARLELATILYTQGVYIRAGEQYDAAAKLLARPLTEQEVQMWASALAAGSRSEDALTLLSRYENGRRARASAEKEAGGTPEDTRLPVNLVMIRLAIHSTQEDGERTRAAYNTVRDQLLASGTDAAALDADWIGAVFGYDLDTIEANLRDRDANDPLVKRAKGWLAVHEGDSEQAKVLLEPLVDRDPFAELGLASLKDGRIDLRRRAFQDIIYGWPTSPAALIAARRLATEGLDVRATPTGERLSDLMDKFPGALWNLNPRSMRWVDSTLSLSPGRFNWLDTIPAELAIRNTTLMTLGIGPDAAITGQVRLMLTPSAAGRQIGILPPVVVQLDRVLTLAPGESTTVKARLDRTVLGQLIKTAPATSMTLNTTAIFDPRDTNRGYRLGPLGSTKTVHAVSLRGQPITRANLDQWLTALNGDDLSQQMVATGRLMFAVSNLPPDLDTTETRQQIGDAINQRIGEAGIMQHAWAAAFLVPNETGQTPFRRIVDQFERSEDPAVRCVYLASQVKDPDAPALAAAIRSENDTIRRFAEALREGLRADAVDDTGDAIEGAVE